MKKFFIIMVLALTSVSTFARDSDWKLCKGKVDLYEEPAMLVVNVFEHRSKDGLGRVTDLTLIYGGHVLQGSLDTTENEFGNVILKNSDDSFYAGYVGINYESSTIALNGTMELPGETLVKTVLKCTTLSN